MQLTRSLPALLVTLVFAVPTRAERVLDALPHAESFDAESDYADIVWVTQDCAHEWVANGFAGGAARFTPPTTGEGACGLGQFLLSGLSSIPEQLNVRFLIFHGSTWLDYGPGNKLVIMNREGNDGRPMIITRKFPDAPPEWETWGACDGTVCRYEEGDFWPLGGDRLRIGDAPNAREEEWISVEFEANTVSGWIRLYVDTADEELSGLYVERYMDDTGPGGTWSYIDLVGGYMEAALQADPDSYFMIDELAIASDRIGPPAGFVGGAGSPGVGGSGGMGPSGGGEGGAEPAGTAGEPAAEGGAASEPPPEGGAPVIAPPPRGGATNGGRATTGGARNGGDGGAGSGETPSMEDDESDAGCGCVVGTQRSSGAGWLAAWLVVLFARRRARRM